mmetsp:Transcript_11552/g.42251  ORF Transcript_11552/g.42251 Transcript_11552/m.42251 type:complete len:571 (-) Transcript_11552:6-1718(-)
MATRGASCLSKAAAGSAQARARNVPVLPTQRAALGRLARLGKQPDIAKGLQIAQAPCSRRSFRPVNFSSVESRTVESIREQTEVATACNSSQNQAATTPSGVEQGQASLELREMAECQLGLLSKTLQANAASGSTTVACRLYRRSLESILNGTMEFHIVGTHPADALSNMVDVDEIWLEEEPSGERGFILSSILPEDKIQGLHTEQEIFIRAESKPHDVTLFPLARKISEGVRLVVGMLVVEHHAKEDARAGESAEVELDTETVDLIKAFCQPLGIALVMYLEQLKALERLEEPGKIPRRTSESQVIDSGDRRPGKDMVASVADALPPIQSLPLSSAARNAAGLLATELKAPLRALRGLAHMLQSRPGVGEVERDLVDGVLLQSEALQTGIDQLGNVLVSPTLEREVPAVLEARIKPKPRALPPALSRDAEPLNATYGDVHGGLEQLLDAAASIAKHRSIHISWEIQEPLPSVRGSRVSVMGILSAVLDSAVQVAPSRSRVEVVAFDREGMVVVEVKDEGSGVQVVSDGMGLARSQIDAMGGQLIVNHPLGYTGDGRRYGTQIQLCFARP